MIERYSDHAANERTFLAWVRTAIAVMAFGFLIERFDLFLRFATLNVGKAPNAPHREWLANAAGMAFLLLGLGMIATAAWRFFRTSKEIDAQEEFIGAGARFDRSSSFVGARPHVASQAAQRDSPQKRARNNIRNS